MVIVALFTSMAPPQKKKAIVAAAVAAAPKKKTPKFPKAWLKSNPLNAVTMGAIRARNRKTGVSMTNQAIRLLQQLGNLRLTLLMYYTCAHARGRRSQTLKSFDAQAAIEALNNPYLSILPDADFKPYERTVSDKKILALLDAEGIKSSKPAAAEAALAITDTA